MLRKIFFTLTIVLLVMGAEALAQSPTANLEVWARVYKAITLTKNTELVFGQLAVGPVGGTVSISTTGERTKTGDIALVNGLVSAAQIFIEAEGGMPITITMDDLVELSDGENHTLQLDLTSSQPIGESINLDGTGLLTVNVGGTVDIPTGSVTGIYTGTVNFSVVYY